MTLRALLVAALLGVALAPAPAAQGFAQAEDVQVAPPGYFVFARPGDPIVAVTAVGALPATGRYVVSQGTTLADLLALAGGATPDRAGRARVRLYRDGQPALDADVRSLYAADAVPRPLREGDVVEVVGLTTTAPGYYVHTSPDVEPVVATVAGAVTSPGRFAVDPGTTVADLLALAGGTRSGELDEGVETTTTVRLYRDGHVAFEALLTETYARPTPALQTGDVVELEVVTRQRSTFTWRDGLSIVTAAVAVVIAVDRVIN